MSKAMNRRTFLGQVARTATAGAVLGSLEAFGNGGQPTTEPELEWRNKQPTMAYAQLGRSGFMVSRVAFGAGGLYSRDGADRRILEIAIERGVNYVDTGRPYTNSEAAIAGIAKRHRDRIWIVRTCT